MEAAFGRPWRARVSPSDGKVLATGPQRAAPLSGPCETGICRTSTSGGRRGTSVGRVLDCLVRFCNPGLQSGSERCVMRAYALGLVFAVVSVAAACSSIQPGPPVQLAPSTAGTTAPAPRTASLTTAGGARRCPTVAGMLRDGQRVCLPCGGATLNAPRRPMVCENGVFRAAGECVPARECK